MTQQAKHTPGPWKITAHYSDQVYRLWDEDGNYPRMRDTVAEMDANARLIAAAPELLAALKELTAAAPHAMKANPRFNQAWHEARAAIAKAEGR